MENVEPGHGVIGVLHGNPTAVRRDLIATAHGELLWELERITGAVPNSERAVLSSGHEPVAVPGNRHGPDFREVTAQIAVGRQFRPAVIDKVVRGRQAPHVDPLPPLGVVAAAEGLVADVGVAAAALGVPDTDTVLLPQLAADLHMLGLGGGG
jgi:hypothetical protein